VTRVRPGILSPIVLMLAVVGAYALNNSITDVIVSLVFGLIAFAMRSIGMPLIPVILGFILGPLVERSYLQTISSYGGLNGFVERPIALVLLALIVLVLGFEIVSARRSKKREPEVIERGVRSAVRPLSLVVMGGFGLLAVIAIVLAGDFTPEGRQFPILTSYALLTLVLLFLVIALVPVLRRRFGGVISDGGGIENMAIQVEHETVDLIEQQQGVRPSVPGFEDRATAPDTLDSPETQTVVRARDPEEDGSEDRRRLWVSLGLVVLTLVSAVLIGVALTVPLVISLFMRLVSRESWRATIATTVLTSAALYLVFVQLLMVPLEGGSLLQF
jgi:hypothetical protein